MTIWVDVCKSDPATLKEVKQRGGFHAIDAQSQLKRGTEMWGPYGAKWGVRAAQYGEIRNAEGNIIEVTLEAEFFYPFGAFCLSTDAAYKPGNDTRKKLLTDLRSKALSMLGFNSDVFEGKFDGDKYSNGAAPASRPPTRKADTPPAQKGALSEKQIGRLFAIAKQNGWEHDQIKAVMRDLYGTESTKDLTRDQYNKLCGDDRSGIRGVLQDAPYPAGQSAPPDAELNDNFDSPAQTGIPF